MNQYELELNRRRAAKAARPRGLSVDGLRLWGVFFALMGIVSTAVLQNGMLDLTNSTNQQLLALMESSPEAMIVASVALILQFASYCAIPIFAALAAEGITHTHDYKAYILRVAALALISELPYNLAMGGLLLDLSGRNPVFGMLLALVVVWFVRQYADGNNKGRNLLLTVVFLAVAGLWSSMLKIDCGLTTAMLVTVLWKNRHNTVWQLSWGTAVSVLKFPAPLGLLALYGYNGEKGKLDRKVVYGWYPVCLLVCAAAGWLMRGL